MAISEGGPFFFRLPERGCAEEEEEEEEEDDDADKGNGGGRNG